MGELLEILRTVKLEDGDVLLEFPVTPGGTYYIEYSADLTDWKLVPSPIVPTADRYMWIDSGPPKTESHPSTGTRFYRVLEAQ